MLTYDTSGRPRLSVSIANSGGTLAVFVPGNNEPPSTNFATLDLRNYHPVLDFDDGTNESAIFSGVMPNQYQGGGIKVIVHFSMQAATSGNVDWDVYFERLASGGQDTDSDSYTVAPQSSNDVTVDATSGTITTTEITFADGSQMDAVAAGDLYRIKVTRDAVSDTASGDAELHAVEVREQ